MEKEAGKVTHYFDKALVAVIKLNADLKIGDRVKFVHGDKEFEQVIGSMEIDRKPIQMSRAGEEVAIKVDEATHEHAKVYKIE